MASLQELYQKTIVPALKKDLGVKNNMAVPRIVKVVVASGVGKIGKDSKMVEVVEKTLTRITGQKPLSTVARASISNFKLREGQVVGYKVTLRGARMYDFLQKLVNITFPRVRDFRGLSTKTVDQQGNMSIGFKEHLSFPEVRSDEVDQIHGLEITIHTSAGTKERGLALLRAIGMPFQDKIQGK